MMRVRLLTLVVGGFSPEDGVNRVGYIFEALRRKAHEAEEASVLAQSDLQARSFTGNDPQSEVLLTQLKELIEENNRVGSVLQVRRYLC